MLEHIPDDQAALAEIRRVLTPDGIAFISVPLFGEHTREFGRVDPHEHLHVRDYGRDFQQTLEQYFEVTVHEVSREYDSEWVARCGLLSGERIYACRRTPH